MQYKHKNHPGVRTDRRGCHYAITHKALYVYLYTEAMPQLLQQIQRNSTVFTVSSEPSVPVTLIKFKTKTNLKQSPLVTQGLDQNISSFLLQTYSMYIDACVLHISIGNYYIHYEACLVLGFLTNRSLQLRSTTALCLLLNSQSNREMG